MLPTRRVSTPAFARGRQRLAGKGCGRDGRQGAEAGKGRQRHMQTEIAATRSVHSADTHAHACMQIDMPQGQHTHTVDMPQRQHTHTVDMHMQTCICLCMHM